MTSICQRALKTPVGQGAGRCETPRKYAFLPRLWVGSYNKQNDEFTVVFIARIRLLTVKTKPRNSAKLSDTFVGAFVATLVVHNTPMATNADSTGSDVKCVFSRCHFKREYRERICRHFHCGSSWRRKQGRLRLQVSHEQNCFRSLLTDIIPGMATRCVIPFASTALKDHAIVFSPSAIGFSTGSIPRKISRWTSIYPYPVSFGRSIGEADPHMVALCRMRCDKGVLACGLYDDEAGSKALASPTGAMPAPLVRREQVARIFECQPALRAFCVDNNNNTNIYTEWCHCYQWQPNTS